MPRANRFRHQPYTSAAPTSPFRQLSAPSSPAVGSSEFLARLRVAGQALRRARVGQIVLVHGTFVGNDALGLVRELARWDPAAGAAVAELNKSLVDRVVGEAGNYTDRYARTLETGLDEPGQPRILVRRFDWSSQNNHIGRADGAIGLIDWLATQRGPADERILLWGHSHAGNVFALVTNLLAADAATRDQFFDAARVYYRGPFSSRADAPEWPRVRELLAARPAQRVIDPERLDFVTFGMPIRYGFDTDGYGRLLHFVHHRPSAGRPGYLAKFPPTTDELLRATGGDYVQQMGIAGTNITANWLRWRSGIADWRLNQLLQRDVRARDLWTNLSAGQRVPEEGTTLLVDYGPPPESIAEHVLGHAVYTREAWLLFHLETIVREFYAPQ